MNEFPRSRRAMPLVVLFVFLNLCCFCSSLGFAGIQTYGQPQVQLAGPGGEVMRASVQVPFWSAFLSSSMVFAIFFEGLFFILAILFLVLHNRAKSFEVDDSRQKASAKNL